MAVRAIQIETRYYGCALKQCECIIDGSVTVDVGGARTWADVRRDVATKLRLPVERVVMWRDIGLFDVLFRVKLADTEPSEAVTAVFAREIRE